MRHAAVVFDMDGTLLATERIALQSFMESCERLEIPGGREAYLQCVGSTSPRIREILTAAFGHLVPYEKFYGLWCERFDAAEAETPIRVKDGAKEVLQHLEEIGVPRAVATSTARATALKKLSAAGLLDTFDVVVGGDDVYRGKPDPDIYLAAADRLSVPPNQCLALEDSDNGVRSAHAAGMTVIHIPDLVELSIEIQRLGIRTLPSLWDVHHDLKLGVLRFTDRI